MKCNAKIKEKTLGGKSVPKQCQEELTDFQIFCPKCGHPTKVLSGPLSAKKNLTEVWKEFKDVKSKYFSFSIFVILTAFLLIALTVYFFHEKYLLSNLILLFTVPFALIPFSFDKGFISQQFGIQDYVRKLKFYPHFFVFVFLNLIYFAAMKIICTGFMLNVAVDPILHIVRLIMVLYWIAIIVPAPILMIRKKMNPLSAIILCIKAGKETRWQQFFIAFFVLGMNIVGAALIGLGLLVSIPLSYILIERYYLKLDEYERFDI